MHCNFMGRALGGVSILQTKDKSITDMHNDELSCRPEPIRPTCYFGLRLPLRTALLPDSSNDMLCICHFQGFRPDIAKYLRGVASSKLATSRRT